MDAITRWTFVRHAPVIGGDGILYATHDEPADCSDRRAFAALATAMPKDALLLTSGLRRTEATADAIIAGGWSSRDRGIDARLAEQHYGAWHGLSPAAVAERRAGQPAHKFWFTTADDRPPCGESFRDVSARVSEALVEVAASSAGRNIVAVAHGGTIRAALALALGIDLDRALAISVDNLSLTRIDHKPGHGPGGDWRVVYVNRRL